MSFVSDDYRDRLHTTSSSVTARLLHTALSHVCPVAVRGTDLTSFWNKNRTCLLQSIQNQRVISKQGLLFQVFKFLISSTLGIKHVLRKMATSTFTFTSPIPSSQGLLGHHRWLHSQFPPILSVLHCPLGLGELQAYPFPDIVFPPLLLSALSSSLCLVRF